MQIVGRSCSITGQKIQLAADGAGCIVCNAAYLRSALTGSECPKCHQDMDAQALKEERDKSEKTKELSSIGRHRFNLVGVVVVVQFAFNVLGSLAAAIAGWQGYGLVWIAAGLVWWALARTGNHFGRLLLIFSLIACGLMQGLAFFRALEVHLYPAALILATLAAANVTAACLLFTRPVKAYLDDQRHPGRD